MQRARRLASVAVSATLVVTGLAACRSAPDVAVYYGQSAFVDVAEVQRIYSDARDKLQAARDSATQAGEDAGASMPVQGPLEVPIDAPDVVGTIVGHDVVTRLARERNVSLPAELPLAQAAQQIGLPADAAYVRIYTESRLLFDLMLQNATPKQTTDDDLRQVYEVFEETGALQPGSTFEAFKGQVPPQALETLGRAATVRDAVVAELDELDLRVNPRYESAVISVYAEPGPNNDTLSLVAVPLADPDASPVTDAS